jgi:2'-5' RNA ligase
MPKKRIFIAIQVPEELKNTGEFYLKPFFGDKNIRIPKKEGWHITLVFCGYLDDKDTEKLKEIVKDIALKFKPFEFVPQKILFAPPNRPRMIWLTFRNSPQFAELKNNIENDIVSCQKEGLIRSFRRENREPNPHLTLARFEEKYFSSIKKFLPDTGIDLTKETAPFLVKNIDIMESHLSRTGADYETPVF